MDRNSMYCFNVFIIYNLRNMQILLINNIDQLSYVDMLMDWY